MEATQESTQPCTDPRRMGYNNSGLQEQDISDIVCILHPNSIAAHEAVAATAAFAPQHILQRDELEYENPDTAALDIALRFSSKVQDPFMGFCFGRNKARCDILLSADDGAKKISNTHFRIYLTGDGILMLEDLSTNGTVVDNFRLRKTQKDNNSRLLVSGSIIQLVSGAQAFDEVKFLVRIPSRDGSTMQYTENMLRYFERIHAKPQANTQSVLPMVGNTYGMHWSGGGLYNVIGLIGKGAFATVYKVARRHDGHVYACKELDKRRFMKNGILDQKVDNEMNIMKSLKHPNIVEFVGHHEEGRYLFIVMEYVPCGELSTYLSTKGKIPEDMAKTVTRQLLHALQHLHRRRITHRDIKPDNILISSVEPLRVKLSDFGLSKVVQEESFLKTFCGTLLYCAPEVYPEYETYRRGEIRKRRRLGDPPPKTSPYDQSVDMWSLGAVLFHILSGVPPYLGRGDDRGAQMLRNIMTTEADFDVLHKAGVSEDGVDFVARLLQREPQARPKERECFMHPWIVDVPDLDEYEDLDHLSDQEEGLSAIGEDVEEELDASQLSIHDDPEVNLAGEEEETQVKRLRIDYPPADIRYPSLPQIESLVEIQVTPSRNTRPLFNEITNSVLRSSDVFGGDFSGFDGNFSIHDFVSSTGESISDDKSNNSIMSLPDDPFGGSAPSLMGAENLVRQLNMNSSLRGPFATSPTVGTPARQSSPGDADEPPTTARTPEVNRLSSLNESTPKAKFSRRIELTLPETASERSSEDHENSDAGLSEAFDPEMAMTLDARTGREITEPAQIIRNPSAEFSKPQPLLGKLTTLPGSIFDLTIRLEDRLTSWGRGPHATVCYPNRMDTRIPAYALEVTFWAPAIEARIAAGEDWLAVAGVMAILSTKTRNCIWVNDTELRRGPAEGFHYGKLYSGDIITVYKHRREFLKFRCEFYHGDSARSRPESEKGFKVRKVLMSKDDVAANRLPVRKSNHEEK